MTPFYKSEFIPYGCQQITQDDIDSVIKVLKSSNLTQGPVVPKFEKAISKKVNAKYSIAVNSATSALHLACKALNLTNNDWLWTSPTSFVASANCALYCGAKVDFVDINPLTGLISIEHLEDKLLKASILGKIPKILIVVHLAGTSCDMKSIKTLSDKYNFYVIEDASHALGGKYFDNYVGNCAFSTMSVFSFHPVKIITTGEGGCITTNDKDLARKVVDLRSHGIVKDKSRFLNVPNGPWYYEQQELGHNYRMTDIQAALGLSQLKRLDKIVKRRNDIFKVYKNLIQDLPLYFLSIPPDTYSSVHLAVINLEKPNKELHLKIFNYLKLNNIGVQIHYIPIHLQPYYRRFGFKKGDFPNAESYEFKAISLPIFPNIKEDIPRKVIHLIKNILCNNQM